MTEIFSALDESHMKISTSKFVESYNDHIPAGFPRATETLLKKFKEENPSFFTHGELWSFDEHRKKLMDWFQLLKAN